MMTVREMTPGDYDDMVRLWSGARGVGLTSTDSKDGVTSFLDRNPGLSLVALDEGRIVAAVLCGHDGRRGYVSHLAVADPHRRRGLATELVERCIGLLREAGIEKCHLLVLHGNENARAFWRDTGWTERTDISTYSRFTDGNPEERERDE